MQECFYQLLVQCLENEAVRRRSVDLDPEVLQDFLDTPPAVPSGEVKGASTVSDAPDMPSCTESVSGGRIQTADADVSDSMLRVAEEVARCRRCRLCETRQSTVFGEGNPEASLMFIGEAPGADEDRAGRPFVGRAGKLLDKMISAMTLSRDEVYIANVVKCRPPDNRTPTPDEVAACVGYLKRQIALLRPRVIVCLGGVALSFMGVQKTGISRMRGNWLDFNGIPVMPTFHPAYLLRQESAKRAAWSDLQQVMRLLGRRRQQ